MGETISLKDYAERRGLHWLVARTLAMTTIKMGRIGKTFVIDPSSLEKLDKAVEAFKEIEQSYRCKDVQRTS